MPKHSMKICWLHLVWSTKDRFPFFQNKQKAVQVLDIIKDVCSKNNIYFKIGFVNPEHIHLLVDLPINMTIETMMQLQKGSSSHDINGSGMFKAKFAWARGYGAFSVSENQLAAIIKYIKNQEEHHKKMSFAREWELFQKKYKETVETVMV